MRQLFTQPGCVGPIAVADDGRVAATTQYVSDNRVRLDLHLFGPDGAVLGVWPALVTHSLHFLPDGETVLAVIAGYLKFYRPGQDKPTSVKIPFQPSRWLPESGVIVGTQGERAKLLYGERTIHVHRWRVAGDGAEPVGQPTVVVERAVESFTLWPDGSKLLLIRKTPGPARKFNHDGMIVTLDGSVPPVQFRHRPDRADPSIVSPDGRVLVGWAGTRILVYDIPAVVGPTHTLKAAGPKHFAAVRFHPSGRRLAAASRDGTVTLYDTRGWSEVARYDWGIGKLDSLAFSPGGELAAVSGNKGQIVVWDVDL